MAIYNKPTTPIANFRITRGWPGDTVREDILRPSASETINRGDVVMLEGDNGVVKLADFTNTTGSGNVDKAAFFVIDNCNNLDEFLGLKANFDVETSNIDGTVAVNDKVTAKDGKFKKAEVSDRVIGKVIHADNGGKKAIIAWTAID